MNTIKGDLMSHARFGHFDVIVHGCNCFNNMGAGIAQQIKHYFPKAYYADLNTTKGDVNKLGTYSFAVCDADFALDANAKFVVVNAYTQYNFGGRKVNLDYEALRTVFKTIINDFPGCRIGIPRVGAGYAGGDWEKIKNIIKDELNQNNNDVEITVVEI
tara:strand:+ start:1643 stop:2119 length:477 start_codon:yes stop_codon:yes gene_type:complete